MVIQFRPYGRFPPPYLLTGSVINQTLRVIPRFDWHLRLENFVALSVGVSTSDTYRLPSSEYKGQNEEMGYWDTKNFVLDMSKKIRKFFVKIKC
jgi:hypothetical protein